MKKKGVYYKCTYIHLNIWKYNNAETSKTIALDLYTQLYKDFPKYTYKNYIDDLS